MFHQANTRDYDGGGHSLLSELLTATFDKYAAAATLPIVSPTMDDLAARVTNRMTFNGSGVVATIQPRTSVTISVTAAATVPVTGLCVPGAESYGGQTISYLPLAAGQSVTLSLTGCNPDYGTGGAGGASGASGSSGGSGAGGTGAAGTSGSTGGSGGSGGMAGTGISGGDGRRSGAARRAATERHGGATGGGAHGRSRLIRRHRGRRCIRCDGRGRWRRRAAKAAKRAKGAETPARRGRIQASLARPARAAVRLARREAAAAGARVATAA